MTEDAVQQALRVGQQRMNDAIEALMHELRTIRTGRASTAVLDDVLVDYYGTSTPLNQLASLAAPEPQLLVVQPYDRGSIAAIEKAILQADLGLNPNNDGAVIRVPIPELTEERRQDLAKNVGTISEHGKTELRQIRRDVNDEIKRIENDKEISQDDAHRALKLGQELTDKFCDRVDEMAEAKRQELLTF
ncbi:MAG TPA: ribosome recycling factor [Acidobacteriota bacterium]|nr:ribosome recycling factor [Acidobacteriota bacterium]